MHFPSHHSVHEEFLFFEGKRQTKGRIEVMDSYNSFSYVMEYRTFISFQEYTERYFILEGDKTNVKSKVPQTSIYKANRGRQKENIPLMNSIRMTVSKKNSDTSKLLH